MKHILVATDLTARSDRAIDRALLIARDQRVPLTVLHVVDGDLPGPVAARQRVDALDVIQRYVDCALADDPLDVAVEVRMGSPAAEILARAGELAADLIVLGTHRRGLLEELFLGSTAQRVLRGAGGRPVLVVKAAATGGYRRVVVGVDFSEDAGRAARAAAELLPTAMLHLVHVYDQPYRSLTGGSDDPARGARLEQAVQGEKQAFLQGLDPRRTRFSVREGDAAAVLAQVAAEDGAELLAVGTRGLGGAMRTLIGSVAGTLLRDAPCDVLAV